MYTWLCCAHSSWQRPVATVRLCAVDPKSSLGTRPSHGSSLNPFFLLILKSHLFIPSQGLTPFSSAALSYHPVSFLVLKTGIQYHRVCSPPRSFTGICHSKSDFSPWSGPSVPCRPAVSTLQHSPACANSHPSHFPPHCPTLCLGRLTCLLASDSLHFSQACE